MTRLVIVGSRGRMGQMLIAAATARTDLAVTGQIDQNDPLAAVIDGCDVVVDFSLPVATPAVASLCAQHRKPLVLGTTGHSPKERDAILEIIRPIPVVWASNYSTGVNTLFWLTRRTAEILGPAFDLEIVEMHHRHKQDAPSGTAMTLAQILAQARNLPPDQSFRHGRQGTPGPRPSGEIGIHALRGGDVVGDHTVVFAADGERVELAHKATNRQTFAQGALRAALWLVNQPAGLYSMQDVLGLK
jgi:4-hydroxy-tetrahydrodipicolinate reductase